MGLTNFILTVAGVGAVVMLLRSDVKQSVTVLKRNVKHIRHWLEEESSAASSKETAQSFSSSSSEFFNGNGVCCNCNRPAQIVKAWTNENPGRRFYRCRSQGRNCKFFQWFDVEKPHGWQHIALLEAREVMREHREEIERLKKLVIAKEEEDPSEVAKNAKLIEETEVLKCNVMVLKREVSVMRTVLVYSWIGFAVVVGIITVALK